ncbi:MAG: beta-ketoacyl synthase N-terminal-like domain-containing protein [Methylovulum sp.]|nr:beta-ketoacyl synthase N-terminal-like domain-containing protein [Methylovulum sp.]
MQNCNQAELLVTGLGVTSAIGQGKTAFAAALMEGRHAFAVMQRPGRQYGMPPEHSAFLGAEIAALDYPAALSKSLLRTASLSAQVAMITLYEAWEDAKLHSIAPERIGLVVGGSNFQQRELTQRHQEYQDRPCFLRPTYGMTFMDSDVCGLCTEQFGIQGFAYTVGGASASGQLAILQAIQAVQSGQVDACIALGALMDLSYWECQGLRSMGAMGSDRYANDPAKACRPFDRHTDGFIYGEACGIIVIERGGPNARTEVTPYARLSGWAIGMDGNRNANPSCQGEVRVIQQALHQAGLTPRSIDYINPHGSGSSIGDATELNAIQACGLAHAYINTSKSITGHSLSAAGTVEAIATLLQMQASRLHPSRNLDDPIAASCNWVREQAVAHRIKNALSLSIGFGGINTALCLQHPT